MCKIALGMVEVRPGASNRTIAPRRRPDSLRRQRLLDFLWQHRDCRLLLVCAPAGYGKTTLVVDHCAEARTPTCWYTLSRADTDPAVFLYNLLGSLRARFPGFGAEAEARIGSVQDMAREGEGVIEALAAEVHGEIAQPFSLVLDDFHEADDGQATASLVSRLIESAPDNCHLVMVSRTMPRLAVMPRLMSRREMAALGADDLCFTPEEVGSLFQLNHGITLDPQEAARIAADSGGWIAGLMFTNPSLWSGLLRQLVAQKGRGGAFFEYLSQEVYARLPQDLQRFLLAAGVFSEVEPQLCDQVLGSDRSLELLQEAERRNLFLSHLDSERPVYRFHQLFQDFLRTKLQSDERRMYQDLNRKAAAVYERREGWEDAIRHYALAESHGECARVLTRAGEDLVKSGRWQTLARWLKVLPETVIASSPRLLLWQSQAAMRSGETDLAIRLCNKAVDESLRCQDKPGAINALLTRGSALRLMGEQSASKEDVSLALNMLKDMPQETRLLAEASRQLGTIYGKAGDFNRARRHLERSLAIYVRDGDLVEVSRLHDMLGIARSQLGQLDKAGVHFEKARQGWLSLSNWSELARTLNNSGELCRLKGDHERALRELDAALEDARRSGNSRTEAWAMKTIGDVRRDRGEYATAISQYNATLEIARRGLDADLVTSCTCALADSYRLMGQYGDARFLIDRALSQAEEGKDSFQLGRCLCVLGMVRCAQGEHDEGRDALHRAVLLLERSGNRRELARTYFCAAQTDLLAGKRMGSLKHLDKLAALLDELGGSDFLLPEALRSPSLVQYAASKHMGGALGRLLEQALDGQRTPANVRAAPRILAYAFGTGKVTIDGRDVTEAEWRSQRSKELFFYLLNNRTGVTKEHAFEALWPERNPERLNSCFHPTAHRLRRALYAGCLSFREGKYLVNREGDLYYDVEEFEKLVAEAGQLPRGSEDRATRLQQAIALYKGTFLEDFYSEWCEAIRRKLEGQYLRSMASLGGYYAAQGQYALAIELLEKCLAIDRYQDDVEFQLINTHLLRGNRAAAVQCYQRYAGLLLNDLGIEPPRRMKELLLAPAKGQEQG